MCSASDRGKSGPPEVAAAEAVRSHATRSKSGIEVLRLGAPRQPRQRFKARQRVSTMVTPYEMSSRGVGAPAR
jgi:hypothetical protein